MFPLTPGLMVTNVNPASANSSAYCFVSMFNAAFVILYEGTSKCMYLSAWEIEPREVELFCNATLAKLRI